MYKVNETRNGGTGSCERPDMRTWMSEIFFPFFSSLPSQNDESSSWCGLVLTRARSKNPWRSTPSTLLPPQMPRRLSPSNRWQMQDVCEFNQKRGSRQCYFYHVSTCFTAGSEIRGGHLHVTRGVVAGDDVESTASVRCGSHADLGGRGPDDLSCGVVSTQCPVNK